MIFPVGGHGTNSSSQKQENVPLSACLVLSAGVCVGSSHPAPHPVSSLILEGDELLRSLQHAHTPSPWLNRQNNQPSFTFHRMRLRGCSSHRINPQNAQRTVHLIFAYLWASSIGVRRSRSMLRSNILIGCAIIFVTFSLAFCHPCAYNHAPSARPCRLLITCEQYSTVILGRSGR